MPSTPVPFNSSLPRVLLIDDDADGLELMTFLLEGSGFSVRTAQTGVDGISIALAWQPHSLVIDLELPDMSGHEVAARVRALGLQVKLVALSGFGRAAQHARAAGLDAYLVKPVDISELVAVLNGRTALAAAAT
jgi:CheY-like chemotaxis protein